jgi:uncharacterized protein YjbI with pentapeptide repeats
MSSVKAISISGAVAGAIIVPVAVSGACIVAVIIAIAITSICMVSSRFNAVGALAGFLAAVIVAVISQIGIEIIGAGISLLALVISAYVYLRITQDDENFSLIRNSGVTFGAIGGTSFRGADLTNANFTQANLKNANFKNSRKYPTILFNVCWKYAKNLEKAQPGDSILTNQKVLRLVTSRDGIKQDYTGLNFYGANLEKVKLNGANFTNANLNRSNLNATNLKYATLTEAQLLGSDLRNSCLTGACLENWNIDASTQIDDIECDYIYLQNGESERRPHDPDATFASGDFSNLYKEVVDTVEILLKDSYRNAAAYSSTLQAVMAANPSLTPDTLQSVKRVGEDDVQLTFDVPPDTDKADLEKQFQQIYVENQKLFGQVEKYKALSEAEARRADDLKEMHCIAISHPTQHIFNQISGEKIMNNPNNQSLSAGDGSLINTGNQTFTGSTINLGTIIGNLTNTLTQLESSDRTAAADLADHLTQLQTAIEADTALPDSDKAETLQKVDDLAKAGTTPEDTRRHGTAKSAIDFLKGTITALPKATAFAEACHRLLPLISTALKGLGLPL